MNPIQRLKERLLERFPDATFSVDSPQREDGQWWLDVKLPQKSIVVAWQGGKGFGVSDSSKEVFYGEGHDHVMPDLEDAYLKACSLLGE